MDNAKFVLIAPWKVRVPPIKKTWTCHTLQKQQQPSQRDGFLSIGHGASLQDMTFSTIENYFKHE